AYGSRLLRGVWTPVHLFTRRGLEAGSSDRSVKPSIASQQTRVVIVRASLGSRSCRARPAVRYFIGQQAKLVVRLRRVLPAGMYEQGVRRTFSLDRKEYTDRLSSPRFCLASTTCVACSSETYSAHA